MADQYCNYALGPCRWRGNLQACVKINAVTCRNMRERNIKAQQSSANDKEQ